MRNNNAKLIALGGLLAALAVVIMCLGGLIPVATYVCFALCLVLCQIVLKACDRRITWAWYGVVSILGLLLGTDKEAAALFFVLGYYPILKPWFEKRKLSILLKLLFFNLIIIALYWCLIHVMGMAQLSAEFAEFGKIGLVVLLVLGNIVFIFLDRLLSMFNKKRR